MNKIQKQNTKNILLILTLSSIISFININGFIKLSIMVVVCTLGYMLFLRQKTEIEEDVIPAQDLIENRIITVEKEADDSKLNEIKDIIKIAYNNVLKLQEDIVKIIPIEGDKEQSENADIKNQSFEIFDKIYSDSNYIKNNVIKTYEVSDNISKTATDAFNLSENVKSEIKVIVKILEDTQDYTIVLNEHSEQIGTILEIMSDISDKIHVLSINALIVSARAGSFGRGFEVVAREIRKLAEETSRSLSKIDVLIKNIQESIVKVVGEIKDATEKAEDIMQALITVAGALQGVILSIDIINTASNVSKNRSEGLSDALNSLNDFIKVNADNKEQTGINIESTEFQIKTFKDKLNTIEQTIYPVLD